ncbi:hypothetical protein [Aeromonas sp. MdU4]|uniref:hypothetical protein n=1 Tax=Aeromonas sp. MdU4 TaxID=3342819 RepID=UPI0035B7043F
MKMYAGTIVSNTFKEIEVVYPKFGFFHSIAEVCQSAKLLVNGLDGISLDIRTKLFRKEPFFTTPCNEFSESIWTDGRFADDVIRAIEEIDYIIIEVSSLTYFKCQNSGMFLHWNPNYSSSFSYGDIYPDGYYEKIGLGNLVQKCECDEKFLVNSLNELLGFFPKVKLIVTGHINDQSSYTRTNLNKIIENAVSKVDKAVFFDNRSIFERFGYNVIGGQKDPHHLTNFGEKQLGIELQNTVIKNER